MHTHAYAHAHAHEHAHAHAHAHSHSHVHAHPTSAIVTDLTLGCCQAAATSCCGENQGSSVCAVDLPGAEALDINEYAISVKVFALKPK